MLIERLEPEGDQQRVVPAGLPSRPAGITLMSDTLCDMIDDVIRQALQEDVDLSQVHMAIHDRYIDLDINAPEVGNVE